MEIKKIILKRNLSAIMAFFIHYLWLNSLKMNFSNGTVARWHGDTACLFLNKVDSF